MKLWTVLAVALTALNVGGLAPAFGAKPFFYTQPCTLYAPVGSQAPLDIMLQNSSPPLGVQGYQVSLHWNSSVLRCDSLLDGSFFGSPIHGAWAITADSIFAASANTGGPIYGSGQLCHLSFHVLAVGSCSLRFGPPDSLGDGAGVCQLADHNGNYIPDSIQTTGWFQSFTGVADQRSLSAWRTQGAGYKVTPNPFPSFATVPGREGERFALYDISGRRIGSYQGDRIGEGLPAGVYFLTQEDGCAKPVRIVKLK